MRRALWLSGLLAGSAFAADDAALRVVEACAARLDSRVDVGYDRIQRRCPELSRALANAPWRDLLPRDLAERRDEVSAESLRALVVLVREAGDMSESHPSPEPETLAPVLSQLGEQGLGARDIELRHGHQASEERRAVRREAARPHYAAMSCPANCGGITCRWSARPVPNSGPGACTLRK